MGADVPMCFYGQASFVQNIGNALTPCRIPNNLHAVLIFPHQHSSTPAIFSKFNQNFSTSIAPLPPFTDDNFIEFLKKQRNDLTTAAIKNTPIVECILSALNSIDTCILSRMSGSGSSCFGLFKDSIEAAKQANKISKAHPDWWVKYITLNEN